MYDVKKIDLNPGEEKFVGFNIPYPLRTMAIWVRPGLTLGQPLNYIIGFYYSEEQQVEYSRTVSMIDTFVDDFVPANAPGKPEWRFLYEPRVRIKNNGINPVVFYVAIVGKGLEEMG